MRREFKAQGHLIQSEDGVVVNPYRSHGVASYEYKGEKWLIPYEHEGDYGQTTRTRLYINRGAVYKEGTFGEPVDEVMLGQLQEDMLAAYEAVGCKAFLHQFPS